MCQERQVVCPNLLTGSGSDVKDELVSQVYLLFNLTQKLPLVRLLVSLVIYIFFFVCKKLTTDGFSKPHYSFWF